MKSMMSPMDELNDTFPHQKLPSDGFTLTPKKFGRSVRAETQGYVKWNNTSSKEMEEELKRSKEKEIKYEIELQLKDKKIEELRKENDELIASKQQMQIDHDMFLESMREKNKAEIQQIHSRHAMQKSVQIDGLMDYEKDEKLKELKREIKRLEKMNERENGMFEKQFQIMMHKNEREQAEKEELTKKFENLQLLYEDEMRQLNDVIIALKQEMFQLSNMNIIIEERLNLLMNEKDEQEREMSRNIENVEIMERLLQDVEDSKVLLLRNYNDEMNRIREEIKKISCLCACCCK